MPIDASIALSGNKQPDLIQSATQAFTLKSAMQQSQRVEREEKDQQLLKQVLSDPAGFDTEAGVPIPKPETMQKLYGISPTAAQKLGESTQKMRAEQQQQRERGMKMRQEYINQAGPALATLASEYETLSKSGDKDAAWASLKPKVDAANQQFEGLAKQAGVEFKPINDADHLLQGASQWSKYAESRMKATQPKTPHEIEVEKHNTAVESKPQSPEGRIKADVKAGTLSEAEGKRALDKRDTIVSLTGQGALSEDALTLAVDQHLAGDSTAAQGYARNAQMKAAYMNRLAERAKEKGMGGADLAARVAEFQGTKAGQRTLGTRTANIEMAVTEAQNVMPIALSASEKVDRTRFPTLNSVLLAAEKGTGGEDVVKLATATNALINIYSRAISPSGTPTVSDKDHAREIISNAYSKGQYKAALDIMEQEMAAARKSPGQVREGFREAVAGKGEKTDKPKKPLSSFMGN